MSEMTITEFCDKHNACRPGREWALSTGTATMRDLWLREDMRPEWRDWIATRPGALTDRDLRLYACWCVRQIWHLLSDERSRHAVEVAERNADGLATNDELAAAREAAWEAAWEAARAARAAREAREAAWAARAAAWEAARAAAEAAWAARAAAEAARAAAREAAWEAAQEAAEAARAAQSRYLRENTKPDFTAKEGGR